MEFQGKRLLILGGNPETTPLVEVAKAMGITTMVTSARHEDPAKKAADKAFDVDGLDVPGLIELARRERADGVLVGVADILVKPYSQVCVALGLPCYAVETAVDVFTKKDLFKEKCEEFGIHGIPEFRLTADMLPEDVAAIRYPVMVKPVDNGGGVGMTVCYGEGALAGAVQKALDASNSKRFIVERYMDCDDTAFYYTFKDGYCSASCVYDRYTSYDQPGVSRVCLGGTYPSKHIDSYFQNVHDRAARMFASLGIRDGVLLLQAFYEDDTFYVYDTGFRLQGEAMHLLLKAVHGYDHREMLVRYALTGSMGDIDLKEVDDARLGGKWAATLWFLLREGTIATIDGMDDALCDKSVVNAVQRLHVGDVVPPEWIGTERQVLTRLYLVCDSKEELADAFERLRAMVRVTDTRGRDMVLPGFDARRALELPPR